MARKEKEPRRGPLVIIGGHEDREDDKEILAEVARLNGEGRLVIATVASHEPEGYFETYDCAFRDLGLKDLVEVYVSNREEATSPEKLALFEGATGVFFTGGDQLRITSQIGDTPLWRRICEIHEAGGVIAGTSAGASVMCETMLVSGAGDESNRIGDVQMAPGLGLLRDAIVDQHFAQRGRIGRLLGAVAQNPRVLGIGIDENTGIVLEADSHSCGEFRVLGEGAVYVVDGGESPYSNVADERRHRALAVFGVCLHVLSKEHVFDLSARAPVRAESQE